MDAVGAEPLDGMRAGGRRDLLAVAGEEPDVARGHVALADEVLGRLEERGGDALGVERAAGPDLAVDDLGAEGVVLPPLALDGDDVLVGHHDHRVKRGVGARPAQKHAEVVDGRELGHLKEARKEPAQGRRPAAERLVVAKGLVVARHRGDAQQLAEALDSVVARLVVAGVQHRPRRMARLQGTCALLCLACAHDAPLDGNV